MLAIAAESSWVSENNCWQLYKDIVAFNGANFTRDPRKYYLLKSIKKHQLWKSDSTGRSLNHSA